MSASNASQSIGSMIFAIMGSLWVTWWAVQVFGPRPGIVLAVAGVGLSLFSGAFLQYRRQRAAYPKVSESPEQKRNGRVFSVVNILQGIGIFLAANVTNRLGHEEWFVPIFIFIVGAHFLPLGIVFKTRRHYVVGLALICVAAIYPFVARSGPADPVGCLGAGLILWASAFYDVLPIAV